MSNMLEKARKYETEKIAATDPQTKPLFHVSAPTGWINDPNGFSFYDGQIHLFYQYHIFFTSSMATINAIRRRSGTPNTTYLTVTINTFQNKSSSVNMVI